MSVLVPSLTNHHHHHHHHSPSSYFSNNKNKNTNRRIHGNTSQTKNSRLSSNKSIDHDQNKDHVPYGVVNSMKQRLLNKVNESFLFNHNSTLTRNSLLKPSARLSSNENLLQTKPSLISPLKHTTRLSRSQDNLTNHQSIHKQLNITEQFTSYIQPKQEVIIVDAITPDEEDSGQKTSIHRQSYTELHVDEAPKPGTVTTVKNMFERQIRLSRYDADKLVNSSTPTSSRMGSQHREISSPNRSRSISPTDVLYRQRRTVLSAPTISLPVPTSYPDVVISHTPPAEPTKPSVEQIHQENLLINNQSIPKEKKLFLPNRNAISHEPSPLCVIVDESSSNVPNHQRPNLLLPSISSSPSETVDCQPLDFKSRLALFNRTNTRQLNENSLNTKKSNHLPSTKSVLHPSTRAIHEEKKEVPSEIILPNTSAISISRAVVNTAKAVTFFGGDKLNGNTKSSLPKSIAPPVLSQKSDQSTVSTAIDVPCTPNVIGGNVKLNKSSIFSGAKKDARVQFIESVDTFEYPSFEVAMAELGSTGSDDDNNIDDDDDDDDRSSSSSSNDDNHRNHLNGKLNLQQEEFINNTNQIDDVDDDELERLARINAEFNTNNLSEKPLKPKGTLHTFRPTHLDQYELGTQHTSKSSDTSTSKNPYTILARQKLLDASEASTKNALFKQQKSNFDTIQWSSMSTTTDLLF